jgi:ABC-type transport system involved in multi-copper enzyme maturation permease subunit
MIQQLKYDLIKLNYQRRYVVIFWSIIVCCIGYAVHFTYKDLTPIEILDESMYSFRPIYWLICAYMIWNIFSSDYHYGTLKTVIPYAKSRRSYLISKMITSVIMCYLTFICYIPIMYFSAVAAASLHGSHISVSLPFFIMSIGDIAGILFLTGITAFCTIISENEATMIGSSMGSVIIMLILETVETISRFLPTTWFVVFPGLVNQHKVIDWSVIVAVIAVALTLSLIAIQIFRRKDLFG